MSAINCVTCFMWMLPCSRFTHYPDSAVIVELERNGNNKVLCSISGHVSELHIFLYSSKLECSKTFSNVCQLNLNCCQAEA